MLESFLSRFQKGAFIYIDVKSRMARIYDQRVGELSSANVINVELPQELVYEGNFAKMLEYTFAHFPEGERRLPNGTAVTVILPNEAVATDFITVPTMKKSNLSSAIQTHLEKMYRNLNELYVSTVVISANKTNTVVKCVIIQKAITASIKAELTKANLKLRCITCVAFCLADAVLQLSPKSRKHNFLFMDVRNGYTDIVISGGDKVYGYASLPYGEEVISETAVSSEYDHMKNDVAELAVLNAKENAKAKKLTISMELDTSETMAAERDATAEGDQSAFDGQTDSADAVSGSETVENVGDEAVTTEALSETVATDGEEGIHREESGSASPASMSREAMVQMMLEMENENASQNAAETTDEEEEEDAVAPVINQQRIKVFVRRPKKYPKFMCRETPETAEGYLSENFRLFQKHLLLYAGHCKLNDNLPNMEFAIVSVDKIPENIVVAAGQEENTLPIRHLMGEIGKKTELTDYLVLFGALHLRAHSKNPKL